MLHSSWEAGTPTSSSTTGGRGTWPACWLRLTPQGLAQSARTDADEQERVLEAAHGILAAVLAALDSIAGAGSGRLPDLLRAM